MVMVCLMHHRKQPKAERDKPGLEESSAIMTEENYSY